MNRAELIALSEDKFITGGGTTRALWARQFNEAVINGLLNIDDDADQPLGYLSLGAGGIVADVTRIQAVTPTGAFLRDDGTWQINAVNQTLAQTLGVGNVTGGNNIQISNGDFITGSGGQVRLDFGSDNYFLLTTDGGGGVTSNLVVAPTYAILAGTNGYFYSNTSSIAVQHQFLLQLDAPAVQILQQTANTVPYLNASKYLVSSAVTPTELSYVSGVTSPIQTQLNNIISGLSWKTSVRVATTANITLFGTQTIDGIAVIAGDRVLVKNQSTGANNGIYLCAAGAWTRTTDATTGGGGATGILGATMVVQEGTISEDFIYTCSTNAPITIGVTALVFVKTSATTYTGTAGQIDLTGNIFSISTSYVGQVSITTLGTITAGVWNGTAIANANLANSAVTIGSTAVSLGATVTTFVGLTSVTSTTFVGALTGDATNVTGIVGAANGGTGIANNAASTIAISGNFATTFTTTGAFNYTLPTAASTLLANNLGLAGGSTLIGGTGAGEVLTLSSTSHATKGTVAIVPGGGFANVGNAANAGGSLSIFRVGLGSAFVDIGEVTSAIGALWFTSATPTTTNYSIKSGGTSLILNSTSTANSVFVAFANTNRYTFSNSSIAFTPVAIATTLTTPFTFTVPNNTAQTAATASPQFLVTMGSTQWSTGALAATQSFFSITQATIRFVGTSTATFVANTYVAGGVIAGTNATLTDNAAFMVDNVTSVSSSTRTHGIYAKAQTGGTTNWAITSFGDLQIINSGKFYLGNAAVTGLAAGVLAATTNATVVIYDSAGQAYRVPCII